MGNKMLLAIGVLTLVGGSLSAAYYTNRDENQNYNSHDHQDNSSKQYGNSSVRNGSAQISDKDLEKNVRDALSGNWLSTNYKDVQVVVSNGSVTLSGYVQSDKDKSDAEDKVRKIAGVRNVRNQIEVKKPAESSYRSTRH